MNASNPSTSPAWRHCLRLLLAWAWALGVCCTALAGDEATYTVVSGDHPWNIAQRFLLTPAHAVQLARLNGIRNDRLIPPGTRLRIPVAWLRLQQARARLGRLQGDVRVVGTDGVSQAAVEGASWQPGTALRTGLQSTALLEFDDGSRSLVRQLSLVRLVQAEQPLLGGGHRLQLELVSGAIENLVKPLAGAGGRFEIRTPAGIAAVRGTEFRVSATEYLTRTEVLEGAVLLRNDAGETAASAGAGTFANLASAPVPAKPLLNAPDLSTVPARLERLPIDWPVPAVVGGTSYRTQLAADSRFDALLSDEVTTAPRVRISAAPDGQYVLRLRAIDSQGLEGRSSERAIELFTQPPPPILIEPAPEAQVLSLRPTLRWARAQAASTYRLQIFPDQPADAQPLEDRVVDTTAQTRSGSELPPGIYRWRVATIDTTRNRQGPWGDMQSFRRVEPGPSFSAPDLRGGAMTLAWSAQAFAATYRMQLSTDAGFGTVLVDTLATAPRHQLPTPGPGTYHVRVQATGVDGFTGPWGTVQSFTVPVPEPPAPDWRPLWLLVPLLLLAL